MNKAVYHAILFSLLLNVATGILTIGATKLDSSGNDVPIFETQDQALLKPYEENGTLYFTQETSGLINPGATTTDSGNLVFRLLDLIGLGFINKIISIVNHYMYGFVDMLQYIFGSWMNPLLFGFLFGTALVPIGALKIVLTIGYILAGIELWSNKSITD